MTLRQSSRNRLQVETPDQASCDVYLRCKPVPIDETLYTISVNEPVHAYVGHDRHFNVSTDQPVIGQPLQVQIEFLAGYNGPAGVLTVTIPVGATSVEASWGGQSLGYPQQQMVLLEGPRIANGGDAPSFPGSRLYSWGVMPTPNPVPTNTPVTYTITLDYPLGLDTLALVATVGTPGGSPQTLNFNLSRGQTERAADQTLLFPTPGISNAWSLTGMQLGPVLDPSDTGNFLTLNIT